jgi:hypothetical protein
MSRLGKLGSGEQLYCASKNVLLSASASFHIMIVDESNGSVSQVRGFKAPTYELKLWRSISLSYTSDCLNFVADARHRLLGESSAKPVTGVAATPKLRIVNITTSINTNPTASWRRH